MDAGMAPAHGLVRFCVCPVQHTRTMQRAIAQVERCDVVAELADVARQREAGLVVAEDDIAPLRLHANELKRELACARSMHQFVHVTSAYDWAYRRAHLANCKSSNRYP